MSPLSSLEGATGSREEYHQQQQAHIWQSWKERRKKWFKKYILTSLSDIFSYTTFYIFRIKSTAIVAIHCSCFTDHTCRKTSKGDVRSNLGLEFSRSRSEHLITFSRLICNCFSLSWILGMYEDGQYSKQRVCLNSELYKHM